MPQTKPNLLFLIADDHAAYVQRADGNKLAHTPNLDRLASEGTRFAANYCNSPVCTPSRQSILTGLYPHAAGVTTLKTPLNEDRTTLADLLLADGYQTGVFGKMHFNHPGTDGMHGFATAMTEDRINRGWQAAVGRPRPPWRPFQDPARQWLNAAQAPQPFRDAEMRSTWQLEQAKAWMTARHKDSPFALWFSIQEPHSPFDFPLEEAALFNRASFRVPEAQPQDLAQIPLIFRDLSNRDKQGIAAAYYTSTSFLDRNMGRMLAHLRALQLEENTLVVYMADHGYSLGQHGRFEKHCFYEPAMRVPLIFRFPGRVTRGRVVKHQTESVDVPPTILELLGSAHRFDRTHGRSLFAAPAREDILSVYLENEEACLLWREWKLIYTTGRRKRLDGYETDNPTPGRTIRLYDRRNDLDELWDVAAKHPALVQTLTHRLETRMQASHPEGAKPLDELLRPRDV